MDFERFTEKMTALLKERLGDGFEVSVHEELKNNGVRMRGIRLQKEGARFEPVLYLEEAYEKCKEGMDIQEALEELLCRWRENTCEAQLSEKFCPEAFGDYSSVKEHLRLRLVNYEKNTELLAGIPHIRWHDLAVIFCYEVDAWEGGCASILVRNCHLAMWGETADALENMKNKVPDDMFSLGDLFLIKAVPDIGGMPPMYALTNGTRKYGAAVMLYSGRMKELADTTGSDLVILPSSLHEVLLLPDNEGMHGRWEQVVREVNRTMVEPEEVLSDHIYRYNREKDAVELLAAG